VVAGAGFPVDGTVIITYDVLFDMLEFGVMTDFPDFLYTQFAQVVAYRQ